MRTKTFVLFLICIVITSVFLCLFGSQRPTIQTIVTETHKQLKNLKNLKENLRVVEEKRLVVDTSYLQQLGFTDNPQLYPDAPWKNVSVPLIVTAVDSEDVQTAIGFVRSVHRFLPNHTMVLYNLGLSQSELELLLHFCNNSKCWVEAFNYDLFPSHVKDGRLHAYRPLIIQISLMRSGVVLWLDVDRRLTTGRLSNFLLRTQRNGGFLAWSTPHPTSSLTHPKMLDYFRLTPDNFYFQRMVSPSQLLIFSTPLVHRKVMLPWSQCALLRDCIDPIGAQSAGCRFDKKPHYRYSGCHRYDASALNIVLGLAFDFRVDAYACAPEDNFVRLVSQEGPTLPSATNGTLLATYTEM